MLSNTVDGCNMPLGGINLLYFVHFDKTDQIGMVYGSGSAFTPYFKRVILPIFTSPAARAS